MSLPNPSVLIGAPLVEIASGQIFKVLCSCPRSSPISHTKRFIDRNPHLYRQPTSEELQSWALKT